jgi:hypothetical protein
MWMNSATEDVHRHVLRCCDQRDVRRSARPTVRRAVNEYLSALNPCVILFERKCGTRETGVILVSIFESCENGFRARRTLFRGTNLSHT